MTKAVTAQPAPAPVTPRPRTLGALAKAGADPLQPLRAALIPARYLATQYRANNKDMEARAEHDGHRFALRLGPSRLWKVTVFRRDGAEVEPQMLERLMMVLEISKAEFEYRVLENKAGKPFPTVILREVRV